MKTRLPYALLLGLAFPVFAETAADRSASAVLPETAEATVSQPETANPPPQPVKSNALAGMFPTPYYSLAERARGGQGTVVLQILVTPNNEVVSVKVEESSGYPRLDASAVSAAWTAKFDTRKRWAQYRVPVRFSLR